MTIKQLEYFMAVARTLSFTDAAAELFISQPALSRSIASLENELGVPLLNRNHHSVALTAAGTLLASELPNLRKELDRITMLVRQTENGLMGHLNIGVLEGQQLDETLQVTLKYFSQSLPLVEVSPCRLDEEELIEGLEQGRLDLIFTMGHGLDTVKNVQYLTLDSVPYCMVIPPDHPLAGRPAATLADFKWDTFILSGAHKPTPETRFLLDCCAKANLDPQCRYVADTRTRQLWIESGFGVSLFNAENRACHLASVRAIPIADVPESPLVLAWKGNTGNPSVRLFTHITECCL